MQRFENEANEERDVEHEDGCGLDEQWMRLWTWRPSNVRTHQKLEKTKRRINYVQMNTGIECDD